MKKCKIYPVIHYLDMDTTMRNVEISIETGCDGVFLIHMNGEDETLGPACKLIKKKYKNLFVGINRLMYQTDPSKSVVENLSCGADATWVDNCGINNGDKTEKTDLLYDSLTNTNHLLFGAVAFKYQKYDNRPVDSALRAKAMGFIPTTSGIGTGHAPDLLKIELMSNAVGRENLAIASGITPENISSFSPYCGNILVSTGISKSFHEFDLHRLKSLVENSFK